MKKITLMLACIASIAIGCKSGESGEVFTENPIKKTDPVKPDGHNSQNALDWAGIYEEKTGDIKTILRLNDDSTYVLSQSDEKDGAEKVLYKENGTFTWDSNGSEIIVQANDVRIRFQVRENEVRMLDMKGNVVDSKLKNFYTLKKS